MAMAARKVGPPEPTTDREKLIPFTMRMPHGLIDDLDALVVRVNAAGHWPPVTRSDVIRGLLEHGVKSPPEWLLKS